MANLQVNLGARSYPIVISSNALAPTELLASLAPHIKAQQVVIVTNSTVAKLYCDALQTALADKYRLHIITIADGEQYKNFDSFQGINTQLLEIEAARDTTIIALGGGVIGDLAGFVAACYQRGVAFIQIPTTLLSQVDSSVGGKTAINHPLGKNMIGAFYQPQAVIIATNTLTTLPQREFAAGMAEVIKYGIIYDRDFFGWIESNAQALQVLDEAALQYAIGRCCEIKAEIVALDEKETGIRALLNLGHTFGHAIEAEQGYGNWLHGEAVAAGIVIASRVARNKNWLSETDFRRITALLAEFNLPVSKPAAMQYQDFMRHMRRDKKVVAGAIRFVIPTSIGEATVTSEVSETEVRNAI